MIAWIVILIIVPPVYLALFAVTLANGRRRDRQEHR